MVLHFVFALVERSSFQDKHVYMTDMNTMYSDSLNIISDNCGLSCWMDTIHTTVLIAFMSIYRFLISLVTISRTWRWTCRISRRYRLMLSARIAVMGYILWNHIYWIISVRIYAFFFCNKEFIDGSRFEHVNVFFKQSYGSNYMRTVTGMEETVYRIYPVDLLVRDGDSVSLLHRNSVMRQSLDTQSKLPEKLVSLVVCAASWNMMLWLVHLVHETVKNEGRAFLDFHVKLVFAKSWFLKEGHDPILDNYDKVKKYICFQTDPWTWHGSSWFSEHT